MLIGKIVSSPAGKYMALRESGTRQIFISARPHSDSFRIFPQAEKRASCSAYSEGELARYHRYIIIPFFNAEIANYFLI